MKKEISIVPQEMCDMSLHVVKRQLHCLICTRSKSDDRYPSPLGLQVLVKALLNLFQILIHCRHFLHHLRVCTARPHRVGTLENATHQFTESRVDLEYGKHRSKQLSDDVPCSTRHKSKWNTPFRGRTKDIP